MIIASITTSLDGYVTGPDDRPGAGLGDGGERLHYWVFGGPWTYDDERSFGEMSEADRAFYEPLVARIGAGVVGRGMYDAAGAWGGTNPWGGTAFVVTHRVEDQPDESSGFRFVDGVEDAVAQARDGRRRPGRLPRRRGQRHPAGPRGRARRRARDLDRPGGAGRGQAAVGGLQPRPGPGDPRGPPLAVRRAHEVRGHVADRVVASQRIRVANVYVAVADRLPNSSSANSGTLRVPRFPVSTPAPSR